jgi:hypothetical protein
MPVLRRPPFGSPFQFPFGTTPGFDSSHFAGGPYTQISVVAAGSQGNLVNLLNGQPGTVNTANGTAAIDGAIGPTTTLSSGYLTYPATAKSANAAWHKFVFGCIVRLPATAPGGNTCPFAQDSTVATGLAVFLTSGGFGLNPANGSNVVLAPVTFNTPCFFAMSIQGTTAATGALWVLTNLQTGVVTFGGPTTVSGGVTTTLPGVSSICHYGTQNLNFTGRIATMMAAWGGPGLSLAQLLAWAQDPFSFWYPRRGIAADMWTQIGGKIAIADVLRPQIIM